MKSLGNEASKITLEEEIPAVVFKAEVATWAERIGVKYKEIHLRGMKNKWGSCSTSGRLTFNSELLFKTAFCRAEIIVPELLHLKMLHHGRVFESLAKSYLAKYR